MADELKPCPFCGNKARIKRAKYNPLGAYGKREDDREWFGVWCHSCKVSQPQRRYATKEDAIDAWNKRVPQTTVNQFGENCTHISNCGTLNLNL